MEGIVSLTKHHILFTGHMIDQPDRKEPRFPADQEDAARESIKKAVEQEQEKNKGNVAGIAGGACGGDILFHEVCEELSIPTELYLALPREEFVKESVEFAGVEWVKRFDRLYNKLPRHQLAPPDGQSEKDYNVWEHNNDWMLEHALADGGENASLIVLWDKKAGDASGGTEHMVQQAKDKGATTIIIDTSVLFS